MKGGFIHNTVLIGPFEEHFRALSAIVRREYPVETGRSPRSVDLFVQHADERIVIEAELTPRRIGNDLEKAQLLEATRLIVVMPTRSHVRAARSRIHQLGVLSSGTEFWILPLGPALKLVRDCFPLSFNPIHDGKTNHIEAACSQRTKKIACRVQEALP